MMPKKKLYTTFYSIDADLAPYLKKKLRGLPLKIHKEPLSEKNLDVDTEILGLFVDGKVDKSMLNRMPHLKMIAAMSTGYDHIDTAVAKRRGIPVCTVPSYGENTVAEHAMALILAHSRRLFDSVERVKNGSHFDYHGLRGFDLKGKTLGVIGTGRIGQHLITMAKGFEMKVIAYDPYKNTEASKRLGFTYFPLDTVLARADIISLHVPLLPETHHIINKRNIKHVKKGAYIINTARGALIDPEALAWGLESNHIAGAGLDVLETEDFLQHPQTFFSEGLDRHHRTVVTRLSPEATKVSLMNELLIDHPRVLVTPHNAFNSTEAIERILDTTADNVAAFLLGHPQNDVTNPPKKKK